MLLLVVFLKHVNSLKLVIERLLSNKSGTEVSGKSWDVHNSNLTAHHSRRKGVLSSTSDHYHP